MGSIISQPQKIGYDGYFSALSTTNVSTINPETNPSSYPDAIGVFPNAKDIGLIGRDNTDIILKEKQVIIRAGKHNINNVLSLNKENPAFIQMDFKSIDKNTTESTTVMAANKIAIITHEGNPKFKSYDLSKDDIHKIFTEAHPIGRADLTVEALEVFRDAIVQHIHGYSGIGADKDEIINKLLKCMHFPTLLMKYILRPVSFVMRWHGAQYSP
jgi:hypothetical protein